MVNNEVYKNLSFINFPLYTVSNTGKVYSLKNNKFLKPAADSEGYLYVLLYNNGVTKHFKIHRLVALCFINNDDNKPTVNHKDLNRQNNHVDNLEWATIKEQNNPINKSKLRKRNNFIKNEIDGEVWLPLRINSKYNYYVSNKGRIKNNKSGILHGTSNHGYLIHSIIMQNGFSKRFLIHKLIAETFLNNTYNKPLVNHKDGNRKNNNISNLEFVTHSENTQHAVDNDLFNVKKKVKQFNVNGDFIQEYNSISEASKKTGIKNIKDIFRGRVHTAGGYIWKFSDHEQKEFNIKPQKRKIAQYTLDGNLINTFNSVKEAAEKNNLPYGQVISKGATNNKPAYGFIWKYL